MDVTIPVAQVIPWAVSVLFGVLQWSLNRNIQMIDRKLERLETVLDITTSRMDNSVLDVKLGLARIEEKYGATQKELGSIDARFRHFDERLSKSNDFYREQLERLNVTLAKLQKQGATDE